ncbi:YlmH family RNA-binding protein [Vagococcus elongatus]|uniref:RNA-binding protein n=1 Tax=Vagococcus elongatus TaxID=180344 RepID=A0A430AYE4_9ENTE|nr:RNA-binding protein [Vagococcus elongatus]RSU13064.1 RNA-binding protein [Vagococcus elongatus]
MEVNVYQHFRKDEHPFLDSINDWIYQVDHFYSPFLTDFLDPRQQFLLETMLRTSSDELLLSFNGGYKDAERKRGLIYPSYYQPTAEDYEIAIYEILYPKKFAELKHRNILGSLLGTGIKREYFGDILTDGDRWQFFISGNVQNYVVPQLTKIGNISVRLEERTAGDIILPQDNWEMATITVSSLRVDVLISEIFQISRQKAKSLVESNKVRINWSIVERADSMIEVADTVSVRGYGRFRFEQMDGKTRKEKFRLIVGVIKN